MSTGLTAQLAERSAALEYGALLAEIRAVYDRAYLGGRGRAGLRLQEKWLLPPAALAEPRRW